MAKDKVKVIVVDDSALIRALLKEVLSSDHRIDVVACAQDAYEARELIKQHNPDVITLDIEMPKMNGITFLKNLMRLRPMPVVMISTLTQEGAPSTLEALEIGAIDFVPKPVNEGAGALERYKDTIVEKVIGASRANVRPKDGTQAKTPNAGRDQNGLLVEGKNFKSNFICAIGASTGGTEAIKEVITALPQKSPAIVIAQHIPESFSASFAKRVDAASLVNVVEAGNNQRIEHGTVYIAPGHSHLKVEKRGGAYYCRLDQGELVNRHRPSVEVLFDSVLNAAGRDALGVMLTGMGADGAEALLRLRNSGAPTIAQDEATSVVWGMPGAAVKLNAAQKVMPLGKISQAILSQSFK